MMGIASAYDGVAPSFDRHRQLPHGVVNAIRSAVLAAAGSPRPRILDLGAGTGRIGRAFVAATDDYVGVDLSCDMLREFARQARHDEPMPALACADGGCLPFRDAAFDAVLLIQVVGAAPSWRELVGEARRVMRPDGALIVGHSVFPAAGVDAKMKRRLAAILDGVRAGSYHIDTRGVVQPWLELQAKTSTRIRAADWISQRTPRMFCERQPTGARFSTLPKSIQNEALHMLESWAAETFGSLDATFKERHEFELKVFKF
jgi:ubiquinone/menaquinone biosynthesis C-methylase UbiE